MYRDTPSAVKRRLEGDEMKEGEGEKQRVLRGGQTAGLFVPDEYITHAITALSFCLHLLQIHRGYSQPPLRRVVCINKHLISPIIVVVFLLFRSYHFNIFAHER